MSRVDKSLGERGLETLKLNQKVVEGAGNVSLSGKLVLVERRIAIDEEEEEGEEAR